MDFNKNQSFLDKYFFHQFPLNLLWKTDELTHGKSYIALIVLAM